MHVVATDGERSVREIAELPFGDVGLKRDRYVAHAAFLCPAEVDQFVDEMVVDADIEPLASFAAPVERTVSR